ncbi:acyltransferase family protein [Pseudomonas sp. NCCP-436]|uniref:acyltransferase family protein n=1 Tax=Pseudomonas sp. NCCP-436 TaxID=2842481 RepID=UPI001C7F94FD|nr:acyltransferase family protein [Pseudomonas sp. NCCP-436]GIZ11940.1 acyltransferase [Pseudomonas sp. NCCP-436]
MATLKWRSDIDGLRAISVIAVILYHYQLLPLMSGGFVGVDVFFVISGYLITGIIVREVSEGRFSFLDFYDRRVRRILPAALATIFLTLVAGYFILLPGNFAVLGETSAYAALGVANFYFLWNTDYFDAAAEMQPLLHMWSLAVEEQFYLFWPILILLVHKLFGRSSKALPAFLLAAVVVGFAMAVWVVSRDSKTGFYMIHARAWELALGGLLVYAPVIGRRLVAELMALAGMALVLGSVFLLNTKMTFPGLNALYPCLGAALLLWPKSDNTWMARGLSLAPMVFIGKISFSLYLVHWPLVVLYRHYGTGRMPGLSEALVLVVLCFVLAYLCWRFVEQPFRKQRKGRVFNVSVGAAVMCSVAALGVAVLGLKGLPERLPSEARMLEAYAQRTLVEQNGEACWNGRRTPKDRFSKKDCLALSKDKPNVLLLGDSHMMHFSKAIREAYPYVNFLQVTTAACSPVLPREKGTNCQYFTNFAVNDFLKKNEVDAVVFSGNWSSKDLKKLRATLETASKRVKRVLVFGPGIRYLAPLPELLAKSYMRGDSGRLVKEASIYRRVESIDKSIENISKGLGVEFFSVFRALCSSGSCVVKTLDGVPTHYDRGHLTYEGAAFILANLKSQGLKF